MTAKDQSLNLFNYPESGTRPRFMIRKVRTKKPTIYLWLSKLKPDDSPDSLIKNRISWFFAGLCRGSQHSQEDTINDCDPGVQLKTTTSEQLKFILISVHNLTITGDHYNG